MDRRNFLFGLGSALVAAPAVVKAASLMPVRGIVQEVTVQDGIPSLIPMFPVKRDWLTLDDYAERILRPVINKYTEALEADILEGSPGGVTNLLTPQQITREAVRMFADNNELFKHDYDLSLPLQKTSYDALKKWPGSKNLKVGAQLRIRLPADFKIQEMRRDLEFVDGQQWKGKTT